MSSQRLVWSYAVRSGASHEVPRYHLRPPLGGAIVYRPAGRHGRRPRGHGAAPILHGALAGRTLVGAVPLGRAQQGPAQPHEKARRVPLLAVSCLPFLGSPIAFVPLPVGAIIEGPIAFVPVSGLPLVRGTVSLPVGAVPLLPVSCFPLLGGPVAVVSVTCLSVGALAFRPFAVGPQSVQ